MGGRSMRRPVGALLLSAPLLAGGADLPMQEAAAQDALAADRTVVLTLEALIGERPAAAFVIYRALYALDGVAAVDVSTRTGTAIVIYDTARTDVAAIAQATADVGYPAEPAE
jgi:copper chaperone CopZ